MSQLNLMRGQLSVIRSQLTRIPIFTHGRPDDDAEAKRLDTELQGIADRLRLILRDLSSMENLARVQAESARKLPPDQRWQANDRFKQKSGDIDEVSKEAQQLAALVKTLLERNGMLSPMQVGKDVMDLIQEFEKHLSQHGEAGTLQHTDRPAVSPMQGQAPAFESIVPLLTFAYVAIRYWKNKSAGKL